MALFATLASVGMACGPPLVYADQAFSIVRKKDSTGFSQDVCGVVIIANIIRIYFWLGARFETALLVQSILLIISQLILLFICLHYAPLDPNSSSSSYAPLRPTGDDGEGGSGNESAFVTQPPVKQGGTVASGFKRPLDFWQWPGYGTYLEFLAGLILVLGVLQLILGRWMWYIDTLGFVALTIESTLPIPQFISNFRRKSCYGFRSSTLAGWLFGDAFKTAYYFIRGNPVQFKVTGIMTVCWDCAVLAQRIYYGAEPPRTGGLADNDEGESLRLGR